MKLEPSIWGAAQIGLLKRRIMSVSDVSRTYCLKAARTMTFLPTSSPSPQRFYRTWAKQMSPELGEVVTSVCGGERHQGGDQMKGDLRQEASEDKHWCRVPWECQPSTHKSRRCSEVTRSCVRFRPKKPSSQWSRHWPPFMVYRGIHWCASSL